MPFLKEFIVILLSISVLFVAFRYDKKASKRYKKCKVLGVIVSLCILGLLLIRPTPNNWTFDSIHLVPSQCPLLPSTANITISKTAEKNSAVFFQKDEIYNPDSPTDKQVLSIIQYPLHGTFYMEYPLSIMFDPSYDFVGCDVLRLERTDYSQNPPAKTIIDVKIMFFITPVLTRPQLDLPKGYQMAAISAKSNAALRSKFQQAEYQYHYPLRDDWLQQRFSTCAIVANGGILHGSNYGKDIDAHEAVFRFNGAPIKGYEKDVGSKLDFMWSCARLTPQCWTFEKGSKEYKQHVNYKIFGQPKDVEDYDVAIDCMNDLNLKSKNISVYVISYQWMNLADAILKEYVNDPTLEQDRRRSTGMAAFMAASAVCDSIRLYGFGNSANGGHHYWDLTPHDTKEEKHEFDAEKVFYSEVMNGDGIFKKYLWSYNLTSDIKYVR